MDTTGLDLHADAPSPNSFAWLVDTLMFWKDPPNMGEDEDEIGDDELAEAPEPQLVLTEDQHLFIPRIAHPDLDKEYGQEVDRQDIQERRWNVRLVYLP